MSEPLHTLRIRRERSGDEEAIRNVLTQAFESSAEARLVAVLRDCGCHWISLVAELEGAVVGHIVFTPVGLKPAASNLRIAGLAPMAVAPDFQQRGIGSQLVEAGKAQCWVEGYEAIVVLGHPEYYPRFGFTPAAGFGLTCEFDVPAEAFMAMELKNASLEGISATAIYQPAFSDL